MSWLSAACRGPGGQRRGGCPFDIVASVLGELRTTGSPQRVRAELARREQELHRRNLARLGASAALYDYLRCRGVEPGDPPTAGGVARSGAVPSARCGA